MREIKFRVWYNGPHANMIYPDLYWFEEEGIRTYPNEYHEGVKLMQFTGLKDKNGKEIYEGDIVQTCHTFTTNQGRAQVAIEHLTCGIRWLPPIHPDDVGFHPLYDPGNDPDDIGTLSWNLSDFEIIGNIYENPELLEVNKR